ncbi:MAG: NUDIX hydrolase, partial [Limisphaerales bacterium]
ASPLAAAQRELLEETGCTADKFVDLPMVYANPARQNNRLHTFLAQGVRVTSEQNLDAAESIEYEFVEVDVVLDWLREGRFQNALLVSSLLMALSQRFH